MSDLAEKYFEKALTAVRGRDNNTAMALLVEAIKLKPNFCEAWVVRGNVLHSTERHFDALLHYDRAISIKEDLHDAWNNRGLAFGDLGMWDAAEQSFRRSLELCPAMEPHMGLANMYCTIMRLEDAAKEYQAAIDAGGDFEAHFNLGVTLLGLGRWEEGFRQYEWRWQNTPYPPRAFRNYQKWRGENLTGKRILLYPEQGYGDEIMALRFADTIRERYDGVTVIIQARAPMLRLAKNSYWNDLVLPMHGDDENLRSITIDYSCPLLDVPMALGMDWLAVPRPDRYLSADRSDIGDWDRRIAVLPKGLNVGLCWSSGGHLNTARAAQQAKSIPLPWLKPLAMEGVNLISLQFPRESIPADMPVIDWMQDVHDFADTAALIEALDLVITVDTAVAHLAGALGKPVWNFVRYSGYWPWLAPEVAPNKSWALWYPQMTLLRQPRLADWQEPIQRATEMLASKVRA